ncbi:hypothetical protein PENTCL1PPCAC_15656, partial [Pristionchus entomophagus]
VEVNTLGCVTKSQPQQIIIEYCSNGTLLDHLTKSRQYIFNKDPKQAADPKQITTYKQQLKFGVQIARALDFLRRRDFAHNYVAAANVLLYRKKFVKLDAMGLCRNLSSGDQIFSRLESGDRLARPRGCPKELYSIMRDCWKLDNRDRPSLLDTRQTLEKLAAQEKKALAYLQLDPKEGCYSTAKPADSMLQSNPAMRPPDAWS